MAYFLRVLLFLFVFQEAGQFRIEILIHFLGLLLGISGLCASNLDLAVFFLLQHFLLLSFLSVLLQ